MRLSGGAIGLVVTLLVTLAGPVSAQDPADLEPTEPLPADPVDDPADDEDSDDTEGDKDPGGEAGEAPDGRSPSVPPPAADPAEEDFTPTPRVPGRGPVGSPPPAPTGGSLTEQLPEPTADPHVEEAAESELPDPADSGFDPADLEPREHAPAGADAVGAGDAPSADVSCGVGTSERRTTRDGRAELWCADERGRRHGPWVRLYEDGRPRLSGGYRDGRRHGSFRAWYRSGQLEGLSQFQGGLEHGLQELWYESGVKKAETPFDKGAEHGLQRVWHDNGQLQVRGEYARGEPVGRWVWTSRTGEVEREVDYGAAGAPAAAKSAAPDPAADEEEARPERIYAATLGGIGAAAGTVAGIPVAMLLIRFRALGAIDPQGWLVTLVVPPLFAAAGAALALAFVAEVPGVLLGAVGAGAAIPLGLAGGALVGGVVGGVIAVVISLGIPGGGGLAGFALVAGLGVGAVVGTVGLPALAGAAAGYAFAKPAELLEEDAE
jgi:hypothetical protein